MCFTYLDLLPLMCICLPGGDDRIVLLCPLCVCGVVCEAVLES